MGRRPIPDSRFSTVRARGVSARVMASFYFKPANCTGFLCTTLNLLTQN
ncbi:hypothetical protein [Burkholderia pyrrocinia]|nr:hypothetical protein [Burkholderia pyrrocinia]